MLRLRRDPAAATGTVTDPAVLRLKNELKSIDLPSQCQLEQSDPENIRALRLIIRPDGGVWTGGVFTFQIDVPLTYPHEPPKVRCLDTIWHPNIDVQGRVCLNILNVGWNPVLTLYAVIVGLLHLFFSPEIDDPLNQQAAEQLRDNPHIFEGLVRQTMRGSQPHQLMAKGVKYNFSRVLNK